MDHDPFKTHRILKWTPGILVPVLGGLYLLLLLVALLVLLVLPRTLSDRWDIT